MVPGVVRACRRPRSAGGSGALARGQRAQEVRSLAGVLQGAGMLQRAGG